jgi:Pyruvate/2-oxoacid:ferredoxin oxidoreductase delta subunit
MPATEVELQEALDEGVRIKWLRTITQVSGGSLMLEKMKLDDNGVPEPTGEFEQLAGDAVVLALGQDVDRSLLDTVPGLTIDDGVVQVDDTMMTGCEGVFAGGDAAPSTRSVTAGIGQGRAVARHIDEWLRHAVTRPTDNRIPVPVDALNPWYYSEAPHAVRPRLEAARRTADFSEVVGGLNADTALYEARRCMSCGNCFGCDNCLGVCPDNAVVTIEGAHGYAFDYDYCKGCGLCAEECPCGAIVMQPEPN